MESSEETINRIDRQVEQIYSCFNKPSHHIVFGILQTVHALTEWLPLTVRQIYYQLVKKLIIENILKEYRNVSRLLVRMRAEGLVPWSAIEDRSRCLVDKKGLTSLEEHLQIN